ncbi:uncharacterized protein CDAR_575331 [Caerostris darwini]|uniref:Uncharacterized protein n=1 Tax=Caerostris darwini TaxID=1538125 RepID=A0AAV4RYK6_9ARAC|nr:uncharacterized protein CDAR_575331 [Caerostris darwini]
MNLNQATYAAPVSQDQAENIRIIQATANKALKNIQSLYEEIMTPKIYADVEASESDYSNDSPTASFSHKNKHSCVSVPKKLPIELCKNCQKTISYCMTCHKCELKNISRNHQPRSFRKNFHLKERSNSYPQTEHIYNRIHLQGQEDYSDHKYAPRNSDLQEQRNMSHQKQSTLRDSHYQEQSNFSNQEQNLNEEKDSYDRVHHIRRNSNLQKQNGTSHQQQITDSDSHFQKQNYVPHQDQNTHQVEIKSNKQDKRNLHKEHSDAYQESTISYYQTPSILSNSESNDYENYFYKSVKKSDVQFKITIPRPFSLTAENVKRQEAKKNKISKLKEELNCQVEKELNVKFHPKPVPKHVHLPLYDKMVEISEKRKKERKEKCTEIVNEKTKPFNLSSSTKSVISKSKSISCLPQDEPRITFKAKPIPKSILSENVSQKLKDKEEIRKLLIAQRAEEMLRKSSLPFSPKHIPRSHSLFNINDCNKKGNINVTKQTIEAITDRLYTIKCQETIENWNNKVNDLWSDETSDSKQNCNMQTNKNCDKRKKVPHSALPFYNFPVRMTTAASLRDNHIRADIEMRKKREEKDETIREQMARKRREILKNMWPKLKSTEPTLDIGKEIEEKVRSYRASQKYREQEYEKELEEMMKRVSNQFLLIERQSKKTKETISIANGSGDEISVRDSSASDIESDSSKEVDSPMSSLAASEKSDSL